MGSSALVLVWIAADERIAASKTTQLHNNNQQLTCMFIPMHVPGAPRTSHGCPAAFRGSQQPGAAEAHGRSVFNTRLSRPDEHLAPQRRLGSLGRPRTTYSTDSQALTPQEAHGRRSSNGRQAKVLVGAGQPVRPPGTAGYPCRPLHKDSEAPRPPGFPFELPRQAPPPAAQSVPAPSFSTGLALSSVDSQRLASADKAHKVYTVT